MAELYVAKLPNWTRRVTVAESVEIAAAIMSSVTGVQVTGTALPDARDYDSPAPWAAHRYYIARCDSREQMAEWVLRTLFSAADLGYGPPRSEISAQRLHYAYTKQIPVGTIIQCDGYAYDMNAMRQGDELVPHYVFFQAVDNFDELPDA